MTLSRRMILGGLGALPMVRLAAGATAHRLTVIHMNDFHARHEAVDGRALACKPGAEACYGGAARLAAAIQAERSAAEAAGRTVLLVDGGDQFQGSLFYTAWRGEVELAVMHAIGTEAMTLGNHEFDNGPANLARFIKAARFPVISANIDAAADPELGPLLRPGVVLRKGALSIGLVGLTTQETATSSSPGPHVRFDAPGPALAGAAAGLRAQGAQIVLALSHLGVGVDQRLAAEVAGVDGYIGGHSHTLLSDSEAGAAGPAHQAIRGPDRMAVVVQAACYGRYLGRLDLDIADDFTVVAYGGDTRRVASDGPEHAGVAAIVAGYAAQLDTVRKRVIARSPAAIGNEGCRVGECPLGNLVAEAMLGAVHGADVALMNGGGIRTGLPAGDITIGDVLTMLPFGNTVATAKVTGADLTAAVANGLSRAGGGAFAQIAGARVVWNPLAPPAERLVSLTVRQADGSFAPVVADRLYRIVTNNFMRGGGDGYVTLRDRAVDPYDAGPSLDETVTAAFAAAGTVVGATDSRIRTP
jgi:5'-nucleotidase/UDP-sugar diphosphatase